VRGNPGEKKPGSGAGVAGGSEVLAACSGTANSRRVIGARP